VSLKFDLEALSVSGSHGEGRSPVPSGELRARLVVLFDKLGARADILTSSGPGSSDRLFQSVNEASRPFG
jgi:hypothetical protein